MNLRRWWHGMENFKDFAQETPIAGSKIKLERILNREIVVTGASVRDSKFKGDARDGEKPKYLLLQFELDGEQHMTTTGSVVLIDQIERYKDHIPFRATIVRTGTYFTFS